MRSGDGDRGGGDSVGCTVGGDSVGGVVGVRCGGDCACRRAS